MIDTAWCEKDERLEAFTLIEPVRRIGATAGNHTAHVWRVDLACGHVASIARPLDTK